MKIVITTNEDFILKPELIKKLKERFPEDMIIEAVFITKSKSRNISMTEYLGRYLNLLGYSEFLLHGLLAVKYYLVNYIDNIISLKKTYSVQKVCKKLKLQYFEVENLNSEDVLSKIEGLSPDIIFNMGNQIFGKKLLSIPTFGCINKHCSLLPAYSGIYPVWWYLFNNEEYCGISLHKMVEKVDKGEVIAREKIKIEAKDSFHSLYSKCYELLPELIIRTFTEIGKGRFPVVQNDYQPSYFGFPTKNDRCQFFKQGKRIR